MIGTRAVYLRCISFANAQKGWVGTLWLLVTNLPENAPRAICGLYAVNELVVYASGTNFPYKSHPTRVMKTTDGGATQPGEWGWKICFVNDNVGYVSLESFS